ncbi:hypothetical protein QFZ91_000941 [Paraburkholderia sp. JPY419]
MTIATARHMQQTTPTVKPDMSEIPPLMTLEENAHRMPTRAATAEVVR